MITWCMLTGHRWRQWVTEPHAVTVIRAGVPRLASVWSTSCSRCERRKSKLV